MVSSGTVHSDLSSISSSLSNYSSETGSLAGSWKGPSYDSFSPKAEEFVSEYKSALESCMNAFATACDLYLEYKNAKDNMKIAQDNYGKATDYYNRAANCNDSAGMSKAKSDMNQAKTEIDKYTKIMEEKKVQIEANLQSASSVKLTASSSSSSVSAVGSFQSTGGTASVSASSSAIEAHSRVSEDERSRRINAIGGEDSSNMDYIKVPYWDGEKEGKMKIKVNMNLEQNYQNVFRELTDMKYPIKPNNTDAYEYRSTVSGSRLSDHAYGGTIDINYDDNPMVDSGPNPKDDGNNPYVVNEDVVKAFAKQGFYWGGDWNSAKDYMHFSWTGW